MSSAEIVQQDGFIEVRARMKEFAIRQRLSFWRHRFEQSSNGLYAIAAAQFCRKHEIPLPGWLGEFESAFVAAAYDALANPTPLSSANLAAASRRAAQVPHGRGPHSPHRRLEHELVRLFALHAHQHLVDWMKDRDGRKTQAIESLDRIMSGPGVDPRTLQWTRTLKAKIEHAHRARGLAAIADDVATGLAAARYYAKKRAAEARGVSARTEIEKALINWPVAKEETVAIEVTGANGKTEVVHVETVVNAETVAKWRKPAARGKARPRRGNKGPHQNLIR